MKTLFYKMLLVTFIAITVFAGCEKPLDPTSSVPFQEEITTVKPLSIEETDQWEGLLDPSNYGASIILQEGESLQEALNAAKPEDAIFIAPGEYQEAVNINKPGLKLIGLNGSNGENVVIKSPAGRENGLKVYRQGQDVKLINIQSGTSPEYQPDQKGFESFFIPDDDKLRNLYTNATQQRERGHANKREKTRTFYDLFSGVSRSELANGVAHYQFEVRLGSRPFDVVRIHRLVRERRPYHPIHTRGDIFMLHGGLQTFEDIYLGPGTDNDNAQTSVAIYLAANGIDVWGMDLAWTLVPEETTDFTFMKDWGIERDVDHTLSAVAIARLIRGLTGQGFDRMNLLGFSYSVSVGYPAAGRETQQHPLSRDIRGLIAVDGLMKFAGEYEQSRNIACEQASAVAEQIDNGIYETEFGLDVFTDLAIAFPDEPSPIFQGLTNYQAALFTGTNTYDLVPLMTPFWHFVAGDFQDGIPVGLLYTEPDRWINAVSNLSAPYSPQKTDLDFFNSLCNEVDVPIDDHLADIKIPILFIGSGGGFSKTGIYTSTLTSSDDVTNHIISLNEDPFIDFGHADLFFGDNADKLVWEIIRQWLLEHDKPDMLQ